MSRALPGQKLPGTTFGNHACHLFERLSIGIIGGTGC